VGFRIIRYQESATSICIKIIVASVVSVMQKIFTSLIFMAIRTMLNLISKE